MKISTKLNLGFATVLAVVAILAIVATWRIQDVSSATHLMERQAGLLSLAGQWEGDVREDSTRSLASAYASGTDMLEFFRKSMATTAASTNKIQKAFLEQADIENSETRKLAERIAGMRNRWAAIRDQINSLKSAGQDAQARELVTKQFLPITDKYVQSVRQLRDLLVNDSHRSATEVQIQFRQLFAIGIAMLVVLLLVSVLISWNLSSGISRGIASACRAADRIGSGDLSHRLSTQRRDEVGQLLKALEQMQSNLAQVVNRVRQGSDSVASASSQIAQGNQDLSARTESQASALEETAASMEELGSTVGQNAENARQANQLAQSASLVAQEGGQVVMQVVDTMRGISDSSKRIAEIIAVIDGIAFQTNILALNAAVEAARAGEQGRGFAVVAGEVRTLAQRSADAAKEIKTLITDSVSRVEEDTTQVDQAGLKMTEIVTSIRRVTDIMGEISAASAEQSAGVGQVGDAVNQMDEATQHNAALVEEMAAAATTLRDQAHDLANAVSVFKLGTGAPALASARAFDEQSMLKLSLAPAG